MIRWTHLGVLAGLILPSAGVGTVAQGQVVRRERDTTITGPRGRTIERRVEIDRGPGMVERKIEISRPGGTIERDVRIQQVPGPGYGGLRFRPGYGPRPPVYVGRPLVMAPRPGPSWSFGLMAAPVISMPFWGSAPPPPPPVVIAPQPIIAAPGGMVAVAPPPSPAQASPLDPVALTAQRLQSHHASSRRDAAQELGRMGDPRAVPALVQVLKHDSSKDVKIAAANSLGQLGGPEAEVVLERCIIYEKKQDVRDAAAASLHRLRERQSQLPPPDLAAGSPPPVVGVPPLSSSKASAIRGSTPRTTPAPSRTWQRGAEPPLEQPLPGDADSSAVDRVPPPPPTPFRPQGGAG